ncbi:hypothetical protein ACJX0J_040324, partial [Zea mays]
VNGIKNTCVETILIMDLLNQKELDLYTINVGITQSQNDLAETSKGISKLYWFLVVRYFKPILKLPLPHGSSLTTSRVGNLTSSTRWGALSQEYYDKELLPALENATQFSFVIIFFLYATAA